MSYLRRMLPPLEWEPPVDPPCEKPPLQEEERPLDHEGPLHEEDGRLHDDEERAG